MKFFKKKIEVPSKETVTIEGTEVWIVQWKARKGIYYTDFVYVAQGFFSEEDASSFVKALKDAQKLLQYDENLDIKIIKGNK